MFAGNFSMQLFFMLFQKTFEHVFNFHGNMIFFQKFIVEKFPSYIL